MRTHREPERAGEPLARAQVLAAALASAVVIYAVVAWLVVDFLGGGALAGGLPAPVPGVLVVVAAVVLLAAPVVERRIFAPARVGAAGGADGGGDPAERYRLAKLVGFALREAAAVVGLVVGLTTGEPRWTWAISGGTLLLMALAWPRAADLERSGGDRGGWYRR